MIAADWIASIVQPVINAAVEVDDEAGRRLDRMEGTTLALRITGTGLSFLLTPVAGRLEVRAAAAADEEAPAATISGPPASLARLSTTAGTRVLFGGSLHVEGDVAAAKEWKRLFDTLDPDWEEAFARIVGDIPAHEGARAARSLAEAVRHAIEGRRRDLRAWLVDEVEALPARAEVEEWLAAVDRIRADGDRLAARVARLERRRRGDEA